MQCALVLNADRAANIDVDIGSRDIAAGLEVHIVEARRPGHIQGCQRGINVPCDDDALIDRQNIPGARAG